MYYYPMMNSGEWFYTLMLVFFGILFLSVLLFGVIRLSKSTEIGAARSDKSFYIAKERYAKGELTKQEFEQLKKDLSE